MPVLVVPADTPVGGLVVRRILREGGEVRAIALHGGDGDLRGTGAIVARADADDEGRLEAAMEHAHTVVLFAIDPLAPSFNHLEVAARTVVQAATNAGIRRLIATTIAGADPTADEPLRRLGGEVERLVRDAPPPSVVVRPSLVDTPALRDALASRSWPSDVLASEVAPVRAFDLAEAIAIFDAMRSSAAEGHVVFHADGPRRVPLRDHLGAVGLGGSRVGRRYTPARDAPLLEATLGGPLVTEDERIFDAWAFTNHQPSAPKA